MLELKLELPMLTMELAWDGITASPLRATWPNSLNLPSIRGDRGREGQSCASPAPFVLPPAALDPWSLPRIRSNASNRITSNLAPVPLAIDWLAGRY
jgi:hypothetical protein